MGSLSVGTRASWMTAEMRQAVGRELSRRVSYPVCESDIRRWAMATYYPQEAPRRFVDVEYARRTPWNGIVAPEDFNPFAWTPEQRGQPRLGGDPDYIENALGIPGPGCRVQVNGGWDIRYGASIRPGDVVTSVVRLAKYWERQGSRGCLLFTSTADAWTNQAGERVRQGVLTTIRYS